VWIDAYRREAEAFVAEIGREHYLHFAGRKPSLEIEPVYEAHARLFTADAVERLRELGVPPLLEFCVEGLIGRATMRESAALAEREATLELEVGGRSLPFRRAVIEQAGERDPKRRAAIEAARLLAVERELTPLHERSLERTHAVAGQLGWPSVTAMCAEISGIDLEALQRQVRQVLAATEENYERTVKPMVGAEVGVERLRRSDLPAFFRAPTLDVHFPEEQLLPSLDGTLADLRARADDRVTIDAESRPTKSPRAFCAAVRVPDEIYLVIAPHGGRDDYETILHEAGHAIHYAHVPSDASFERRHLGDNSVTEAYAFLMQRLAAEPRWLARRLGVEDGTAVAEHSRAAKTILVRRYAAKLGYELELQGSAPDPKAMRRSYSRALSRALGLEWAEETWLEDVDPFFYAARYLRAWALEAELAAELRREFGPEWFAEPDAGARLRELWSHGQPPSAAELLGQEPRFEALIAELAGS
jgi:hypothetical protein